MGNIIKKYGALCVRVSGVIFTYLHTLVVLIITRERDSRMLWTEGGREGFRHGTLHKHPVRVITTNDKQIQMMDQNPGE